MKRFFLFFLLLSASLFSVERTDLNQDSSSWKLKMRVKTLSNLDQFLHWGVSESLKTYPLVHSFHDQLIEVVIPTIKEFEEKWGYFSALCPIVGNVTAEQSDVDKTCDLLKVLYLELIYAPVKIRPIYLEIASSEILTKVLAYRDLKVGQQIFIPSQKEEKVTLEPYSVDTVLDMGGGMPAFGLIPQNSNFPSILLFRGTDFSLISQRGWASLLSDLDRAGPGLSTFHRAQKNISSWLKKVAALGKKAKVMGFSLGGALAAYTFIYENAELADAGSVAICAPGITDKVLEDWQLLSPQRQSGFVSYVNAGDIVSKVGTLFGTVYCLSPLTECKPLTAHMALMCGREAFSRALVDVK